VSYKLADFGLSAGISSPFLLTLTAKDCTTLSYITYCCSNST